LGWVHFYRSCIDFFQFFLQCRSAAVAGSQPLSLLMNQSHNVAQTPCHAPALSFSTATHRYAQRQRMTVIKISCSGVQSSLGQTDRTGWIWIWRWWWRWDGSRMLDSGWGIWHSCASTNFIISRGTGTVRRIRLM